MDASQVNQQTVAKASKSGMKKSAAVNVQMLSRTVQIQNGGMMSFANVNAVLQFQQEVANHHKDGTKMNVDVVVLNQHQKEAAWVIKFIVQINVHACVQNLCHLLAVPVPKDGMNLDVDVNVPKNVTAKEINVGTITCADVNVILENQLEDAQEIRDGTVNSVDVNVEIHH